MHNWGIPMMFVIWIPFLVIGIVLLIKFMGNNGFRKFTKQEKESPLEILKRRYANGEISTEEYEERKKILEQ